MLALALLGAAMVHAQPPGTAQANANQVRDQLRSSSLREQQRQQTSDTTRKAFQQGSSAQQGIDRSDKARRDRYRAQQRDQVQDYLHRAQAGSAAQAADKDASTGQPAHASSSH